MLWGLREPQPDAPVEVTVVGRNPGHRVGVIVHRTATIPAAERTVRDGIPTTSPARTVIDLAPLLSPRELERAFDEARVQGLLSPAALRGALSRHRGCRGTRIRCELARDARRATLTRSELEERFLALVRRARLPAPEVNARIGAWSVDFFWRAQRVAVELDGYAFHTTRGAFERDREKDHALRARQIELLRFTWSQLNREAEVTLVRCATALARSD